MISRFRNPVVKVVQKVFRNSRRTVVHSTDSNRSFRIANVTDLAPAKKFSDRISSTSGRFTYEQRTELRTRDLNKQFIMDLSHPQGYKRGHIPTAVNVSTSLFNFTKPIDTYDGIKEDDVVELLKYCGIGEDTSEIVLYDNSGLHASRMWLILRYFGVTNIRILNGGFSAWQQSGLPVEEGDIKPQSTSSLHKRKSKREYLITKPSQMAFLYNSTNTGQEFKFIDTRDPSEFKKYKIDGSYNLPLSNFITEARFHPVKEITSYIDSFGFGNEAKFKIYSAHRFSSAVAAFAFELCGRNVSVYDAGINNWKLNFEEKLSDEAIDFLQH